METILVVDDEPEVLSMARDMLEARGFRVLVAGGPEEALCIAQSTPGPIDVLVTDVVMPELNGRELADRLSALRSEIKVIYMSGHTSEVVGDYGVRVPSDSFVAKPFTSERLIGKIREKLGYRSPFSRPGSGPARG
ncbi:MAG TPA: response regulator [Methylomirabilota bacterium]|nr:response regulator [Methylomirabilota bacterium]